MDLIDNNELISVVIPLYNKESSIKRTIQSVLDQTFLNFKIIVVNDGSTDNSLSVVEQFNDSRIKIINKPNGGVSSARNTGIFVAKGLYIAFLDADDIWLPEYLQEIKQLIDEFKDCNIFGTDYTVSFHKVENHKKIPIKHFIVDNYFELAMCIPFLTASSIVVKRDCFDNDMQFNENFTHGEDLDLWSRLYKKYIDIGYSNKQLVYYNHSATNRVCEIIPQPQKHFAYYFKLNEVGNHVEKQYYLYQISMLAWLYLKNLKITYLFNIFFQYRQFILKIFLKIFSWIVCNKNRKAVKNK